MHSLNFSLFLLFTSQCSILHCVEDHEQLEEILSYADATKINDDVTPRKSSETVKVKSQDFSLNSAAVKMDETSVSTSNSDTKISSINENADSAETKGKNVYGVNSKQNPVETIPNKVYEDDTAKTMPIKAYSISEIADLAETKDSKDSGISKERTNNKAATMLKNGVFSNLDHVISNHGEDSQTSNEKTSDDGDVMQENHKKRWNDEWKIMRPRLFDCRLFSMCEQHYDKIVGNVILTDNGNVKEQLGKRIFIKDPLKNKCCKTCRRLYRRCIRSEEDMKLRAIVCHREAFDCLYQCRCS